MTAYKRLWSLGNRFYEGFISIFCIYLILGLQCCREAKISVFQRNNMLNAFFNDIYSVLIGKYYSASILGFYNRAITFQRLPTILVGKSIGKVSYPLFTKVLSSFKRK